VKEPDFESASRGKLKFLPPRFMTVNVAIEQLLEVEGDRKEGFATESMLAVGMARLGQPTQKVNITIIHNVNPPTHSMGISVHCVHLKY
jgi:diphthine methyl ester synthase